MCCGVLCERLRPRSRVNATPARVTMAISLVVEKHDVARVAENRRDVRGDEVLALAEADDHRRAVAHGDDRVRVVRRDQHEREQPAQLRQRAADRRREAVAAALLLDQVRDDLRVRLGDERVALGDQLALQLEVVLDDAVVDDDDAAVAVAVRMGVLLGRPAVRGPARVADAELARRAGRLREHVVEARQLAGAAADLHRAVLARRRRRPSRSRDTRGGAGPSMRTGRTASARRNRRCRT